MKNTLPTHSPTTPQTIKQDPFQRLSLAVKKLDQLINRTHQLGTFTNQLLREETTGPSLPSPEANPTHHTPSDFSTKASESGIVLEK